MSEIKKRDNNVIRQANALTTAAYSLTRNERRLVYMAQYIMVNKGIKPNEYGQIPIEISHADYITLFNDDSKNVSRDIMTASKSLNKKEVVFYFPEEDGENGEKALDAISWTTERSHRPKRGITTLFFNAKLVSIIAKVDKNFTRYLMGQAGKLNNPYAMRLYESLRQWPNRHYVTFSIAWMIERYELPASYSRMSDFRRRFLKPSIEEINKFTSMQVEYEELPDKTRRNRVGAIKFTYKVVDEDKGANGSPEASEEVLGYDAALTTYQEVVESTRLPSMAELDNLRTHLSDLIMDGITLAGDFREKFNKAVELASTVTD